MSYRSLALLLALPACFAALVRPGAGLAAEGPSRSTLTVHVEPQTPSRPKIAGTLTLRPLRGHESPLTTAVPLDGPATVTLPAGTRWEARVDLPGFWVRGSEVEVGAAGSTVELTLPAWPWARLMGRLKTQSASDKLPKEITVTTLAVPMPKRREEVPKGQLVCSVDAKGAFTCSLPASTYDIGLTAAGFMPFYRWGVRVGATKPVDLGLLTLAKGASVAGWVAVEEGRITEGRCLAQLRPAVAGGAPIRLRLKLAEARQQVKVRKDGFFQILGVAPGTYSLEVVQPERARAFVPQVEVKPGLETFVREPIVLHRPLRVEIHIEPPLDWLGQPWQVEVGRSQGASAELMLGTLFKGRASPEGEVEIPGLAPGSLTISVDDSRANRMYFAESVPLTGPADTRKDLRIDYVTVNGTLRLGKEPLAGSLWFGGHFGSQRSKMEAGRDGKFLGVLPHAGPWQVTVDAEDPVLSAETTLKIQPDRHGRASVEVRLPATHVFGTVVDEQGRPATGADVTVEVGPRLIRLKTEEAGKFETRGMPVGMARLAADRRSGGVRWTSSPLYLPLSEDQTAGPIELRLRRTRTFSGSVVSAGAPVPGASVTVFAQLPRAAASADSQATDIEGKFAVEVDAAATQVVGWVMAPGYGLQGFAADSSEQPTLTLAREMGTVVVQYPPSAAKTKSVPYQPVVYQNGLPFLALGQWLGMHSDREAAFDDRLELPEMAPGNYQACGIPTDRLTAWAASGHPPDPAFCTAGVLEAGGTLLLKPPTREGEGASP